MFISCTSKKYFAIEPWKGWEIELSLNKDSTFILSDTIGCNTFYYMGKWHLSKDSLFNYVILKDTINVIYNADYNMFSYFNQHTKQKQVVEAQDFFSIGEIDTILIINKNMMLFKNLTFNRTKICESNNLEEKRIKIIENYYINKMGKKLYIKVLGDGKSVNQARKNLKDCNSSFITIKEKW